MGLFDGFPFTRKEDRERRQKATEKRVAPFGLEAQREKQKEILRELFRKKDVTDLLFALYQAKDSYCYEDDEESEEGSEDVRKKRLAAARRKLKEISWVDGRTEAILLRLVELETSIKSLDDYPSAQDVLEGING